MDEFFLGGERTYLEASAANLPTRLRWVNNSPPGTYSSNKYNLSSSWFLPNLKNKNKNKNINNNIKRNDQSAKKEKNLTDWQWKGDESKREC